MTVINNKKPETEKLRKASEHVAYEMEMFIYCLDKLKTTHNQLTMNLLLDSFAVHSRNLFWFFYTKDRKQDDILCSDFIDGGKETFLVKEEDLEFVVKKANKQVSHLTYERINYVETKPWNFAEVGSLMLKNINRFYDSLSDEYKNFPHFKELRTWLD